MAESLRAVSAFSYGYCRAPNDPAVFINKTCIPVVTVLGMIQGLRFRYNAFVNTNLRRSVCPLPCFKELKYFHLQVVEPKHFHLFESALKLRE